MPILPHDASVFFCKCFFLQVLLPLLFSNACRLKVNKKKILFLLLFCYYVLADKLDEETQVKHRARFKPKKAQSLNTLLSTVALGLFLEGCCGSSSSSPPPSPPSSVSVSGGAVFATGSAEAFIGIDGQDDIVSYENAAEGVTIDLQTPANNRGDFAERDTYANIEDLTGSPQDDQITGDDKDNHLIGLAGDDILEGGAGDDTLEGGLGADEAIFRAGFGNDILLGGLEGDKLSFKDVTNLKTFAFSHPRDGDVLISVGSDSVRILAANYAHGRYTLCYGPDDRQTGKLYVGTPDQDAPLGGSTEADWILGLDNDDSLLGEGGEDILYGGAGDDTLEGGAGDDILEGDAGTDTYVFRTGFGHDTLQGETDNSKLSFEDVRGHGSFNFRREDNGDVLISVGSDSVLIKSAAYANSRYEICAANDRSLGRLSIDTDSNDGALQGTAAVDWMFGLLGDDTLRGAAGTDNLVGGAGNDFLYGDADRDFLFGGAGDDTLYGGGGNDNLFGGGGNDKFYGDEGKNSFRGGAGNDTFFFQGTGSNTIIYDSSSAGVTITLLDADGQQGGDAAGDIIELGAVDNITGSSHSDNLTGDADANTMRGGKGDDTMQGDAGEDKYLFEVGDGEDTISDQQGDQIFLQFVIGTSAIAFAATDFTSSTIRRVNDNLEIILDKDSSDGITDKVTILNAYDTDTSTGTGNAAFTIHISFGSVNASTEVTNDFWHTLVA